MRRTCWGIPVVLALLAAGARAQTDSTAPAPSAEGDYLLGVGVLPYTEADAQAESIHVDTAIRWNEYVAAVVKNENAAAAVRRKDRRTRLNGALDKIRRRILENPEERDVQSGDGLNAVMEQLKDPKLDESSFRFNPVPLSVDRVLGIPFKLNDQGVRFSMQRLSTRGKGKWPVALQDPRFADVRKAYERALDGALEQQIEGRMSIEAIRAVEVAVEDLSRTLDRVVPPNGDRLYKESQDRIKELRESAQLLKSLKVQLALGELDQYSGTTVNDLKVFMQKYKLSFDVARNPDERQLYPELYTALIQQREILQSEPKK